MTRVWNCPECGSAKTHCYDNRQYPEYHLVVCLDCGIASQGTWHPRFTSDRPTWHTQTQLSTYEAILESAVGQEEGVLTFSNVLDRLGLDEAGFELE